MRFAGETLQTDEKGIVVFSAPVNEFPAIYKVAIQKKGYANYNSYSINGELRYAPASFAVSVFLPAGVLFSLPPDVEGRLKRIRIQDTTWLSDIETSALEEKLEGTGIEIDEESGEDEEDILDDLTDASWDDIWVFHGHGDGDIDAIGDDDYNAMTAEEICAALAKDKDPPSIIVLAGCESSGLARKLCECGAKIVVGYSKTCYASNGATTAERFLEALLDGKSISSSADFADDELTGCDGAGTVEVCQGGGSSLDLTTARLGDALYRKPTTTVVSSFIMQLSQDQKTYETLVKADLTDEDGNALSGKPMTFSIFCDVLNQPGVFALEAAINPTDSNGQAASDFWRIAKPPVNMICEAEAEFEGDAEYEPSTDSDTKSVQ